MVENSPLKEKGLKISENTYIKLFNEDLKNEIAWFSDGVTLSKYQSLIER